MIIFAVVSSAKLIIVVTGAGDSAPFLSGFVAGLLLGETGAHGKGRRMSGL